MSEHKENKTDSKMDETSVNKILLGDENSKDLKNKPKKSRKLTISSTQEAGTGSSGARRVKTKITPPDATGYVRSNPEGKLTIDTKAVSQENKAL